MKFIVAIILIIILLGLYFYKQKIRNDKRQQKNQIHSRIRSRDE